VARTLGLPRRTYWPEAMGLRLLAQDRANAVHAIIHPDVVIDERGLTPETSDPRFADLVRRMGVAPRSELFMTQGGHRIGARGKSSRQIPGQDRHRH